MVSGSFNGFVTKLRTKLDTCFHGKHKLVTAYHYNDAQYPVACMDHAWTVGFGPNLYSTLSLPWTNAKWSVQMPNMNNTFTTLQLNQIKNRSAQVAIAGMICVFIPNAIRYPLFRRSVKVLLAIR